MRPLTSVLRGSYFSSTKVRRSRTLPWPPVILAMMSLPQNTPHKTSPMAARTMTSRIIVIILRALLGFLDFLGCAVSSVWLGFFMALSLVWVVLLSGLVAVSSLVSVLKSKAWTGLRKSSTDCSRVFLVVATSSGVELRLDSAIGLSVRWSFVVVSMTLMGVDVEDLVGDLA